MPTTTTDTVRECEGKPWIAGFKLYPAGVTTHSADGVTAEVINDPDLHTAFGDVLDAMQAANLVLCLHGEHPDEDDPFEREPKFLRFVHWLLTTFPKLRVVMEHITTMASVDFVKFYGRPERLAATITAHHLMVHHGHMCGSASSAGEQRFGCGDGRLHPHLFCWPIAKRPSDREALVRAATSGNPCFFLGSDSAPHPIPAKESACGCAGVYSAPVLPEAIVQVFADRDRVDNLSAFVAESGDRFYGRKPVAAPPLRAVRQKWTVPATVDEVVPFLAGCQLDWLVESR
jgi:dihydroorotase